MKKQKLTIEGSLVSLNEYIQAERSNKYAGAEIKKTQTEIVYWQSKIQKLKPIKSPVDLSFTFFCKDKRKDKDNILFCIKYILDGLVKAAILEGDEFDKIGSLNFKFFVDYENPRIEVLLKQTPLKSKDTLRPGN